MKTVITRVISTIHLLKSILCLVTESERLTLRNMHIYQCSHNCKSVQHKDPNQGGTVKEDCDLTCSAAGGGGKPPICNTGAVYVPLSVCVEGSH